MSENITAMGGDAIGLKVDGALFEGWTDASADRSLDQVAGGFSIGFSERWPGHPDLWRIPPGAACELMIGGDLVSTGYTDLGAYAIDADGHPLSVEGRDKTADLVDCSAIHEPSSWRGRRIDQIAADLAAPFGITVLPIGDMGAAFAHFALQQGETVFSAIERMTRQRALLAVTNEAGELELRRPGLEAAGYELILGENIKSIRFTNDVKDRFSDYIIKGHPTFGGGADFRAGGSEQPVAATKAGARDLGVPRYRPLVILNDDAGGPSLETRARWEATTRAGKAQVVVVTVAGWRAANGELYRIDRKVPVHAKFVGVDDELLVKGVRFSLSDRSGRITELTLTRKEAYSLLALPEAGAASGRKGKSKKADAVDPILALS